MFAITGKRNQDLQSANNRKLVKSYFITNLELYGAIAQHLGIMIDGLSVDELKAAINEKNADLACAGVPVAATIDQRPVLVKPVKRCDRKPVERPVLRNTKPVVKYVAPGNVLGKALVAANLVALN